MESTDHFLPNKRHRRNPRFEPAPSAICIVSIRAAISVILFAISPAHVFAECLDYSNSLRWVGAVDTEEGSVGDVAVSGTYAYAANVVLGLQIIEISDPTTPQMVGELRDPNGADGVAVAGTRAYVAAAASGLLVVDVSDPSSPLLLGSVPTSDANAVAMQADRVFLADRTDGLVVIDVSDSEEPRITGQLPIAHGRAVDIALAGDHAYIAALEGGLLVIDISAPDDPLLLGAVETPGSARGVAVSGEYAYVGDSEAGLQVVDVSDPTTPRIIGNAPAQRSASGVATVGTRVFFGDETFGMEVADVTDPRVPRIIGSARTGALTFDVAIAGNYAYLASWGDGLCVIDITTPVSPPPLGSVPASDSVFDVVVRDGFAYAACDGAGLAIVDVRDSDSPRVVGAVDTPGLARGVVVAGSYAYVADAWYGLQVVDVSDPSNPTIEGTLEEFLTTQAVAVSGDRAYLGTQNGLLMVDISDPAAPRALYTRPPMTYITDVVVSRGYLYVGGIVGDLHVYNMQSWSEQLIFFDGWISRVSVSDSLAFAVGGFQGVAVIDVSDPETVFLAGRGGPIDRSSWDVVGAGDCAYVATGWSLDVVDVSDPSQPRLVGGTATNASPWAVALTPDYLYIGDLDVYDDEAGFHVAALHCPDEPTSVLLSPEAMSREDAILISWTAPEGFELSGVRIDRRVDGGGSDWTSVSPLLAAHGRRGEYLDENVEPGVPYEYLLEAFDTDGSVGRFGPVRATATAPSAVSLRIWPNPGLGSMDLSLALPKRTDVLLRVYDVQGRETAREDLHGLDPGVQRRHWDVRGKDGRPLPAGTYFLRIDTSCGIAASRWCVLR